VSAFRIRPAQPFESTALSDLALRSKATWGYSPQFIAACQSALRLSPQFIDAVPVFLLEVEGMMAGFYALENWNDQADLTFFFIEPSFIRQGWGRVLWEHAIQSAARMGYSSLRIESDPNAEAFYVKMGARRSGDVPSPVMTGRRLPLLQYDLKDTNPAISLGGQL